MEYYGLSEADDRLKAGRDMLIEEKEGVNMCPKRKKGGNTDVDMISSMCDVVIHHILAFLPVRDAAKTCILSKRWSKVWASAPVIDFDQKYFLQKRRASTSRAADALANFMSGAILCRERTPLKLLHISLRYFPHHHYVVRLWIQIALKLNVQEMYLDFTGGKFFLRDRGDLYYADPCLAYNCHYDGRSCWVYDYDSDTPLDDSDLDDEVDPNEHFGHPDEPGSATDSDSTRSRSDDGSSDEDALYNS